MTVILTASARVQNGTFRAHSVRLLQPFFFRTRNRTPETRTGGWIAQPPPEPDTMLWDNVYQSQTEGLDPCSLREVAVICFSNETRITTAKRQNSLLVLTSLSLSAQSYVWQNPPE